MLIKQIKIDGSEIVQENDIKQLDETSQKLESMNKMAMSLKITNHDEYANASAMLGMIDSVTKVVTDITERFRKPAYDYYKQVLDTRNSIVRPGEAASKHIRTLMAQYVRDTELQQEAERQRLIAQSAEEHSRIAQEAYEAAVASGDTLAAAIAAEEAAAPPRIDFAPVAAAPDVAGVSTRDSWSVDFAGDPSECIKQLCKAVADGSIATDAVTVNFTALKRMAKDSGGKVEIPGIRITKEKIIVRRG